MIREWKSVQPPTHTPLSRDLLIVFAEFARYSLRSATQTTLDAELENIERYLTLQRARFGTRLQVQLQVVPGALPVVLPFLALQQLVDNAVRNGIEPKQLGGTVTLSARLDGPECLITVQDDGPGEGDAELPATLRTIDNQLREMFSERYGVVADFIPGTGTTISLRVPTASCGQG
jgi:two-component system, LytTR family, sensor kinase